MPTNTTMLVNSTYLGSAVVIFDAVFSFVFDVTEMTLPQISTLGIMKHCILHIRDVFVAFVVQTFHILFTTKCFQVHQDLRPSK